MKTETRDTVAEIIELLSENGYSNIEDMEDSRRNMHKVFVPETDLSGNVIEMDMYELAMGIEGLKYYDSVIVATENGDKRDGAVVTFEEVVSC